MKPLLITASLLSSWLWYLNADEPNLDEFKTVLRREKTPDNPAMQAGRAFEVRVRMASDGYIPNERDQTDLDETARDVYGTYTDCVNEVAGIVAGGVWQYSASKNVIISGTPFVLYGRIDVLKGAWVYDTKFTRTFDVGKYFTSPQTKMYIALVPETIGMKYLACDGNNWYEDSYRREDIQPIENDVRDFWNWLQDKTELLNLYVENWQSKY